MRQQIGKRRGGNHRPVEQGLPGLRTGRSESDQAIEADADEQGEGHGSRDPGKGDAFGALFDGLRDGLKSVEEERRDRENP